MSETLLPQRFLFQLAVPCRWRSPLWNPADTGLEPAFRLLDLGTLEGRNAWAEIRAAWSDEGLAFAVHVRGKRQAVWCRASRPEDSDGLQVWIDTRDVHNVHRAGRFCQSFLFLPSGGGMRQEEPLAQAVPINRAREVPRPVPGGLLRARASIARDGYRLETFIPAAALAGFDAQEHPRLGFTYAVTDRELGQQTFGVGAPMPFAEDPSLWPTLELVRN